jgi:hypothetical protein
VPNRPASSRLLKSFDFLKDKQNRRSRGWGNGGKPIYRCLVLVFLFTAVWDGWLEPDPLIMFSSVSRPWGMPAFAKAWRFPSLFPAFASPFTRFSLGRFGDRISFGPFSPGG